MTATATATGAETSPSEILADLGRRRARRRLAVGLALASATLAAGPVAWKAGRHAVAATYLGARSYMVIWDVEKADWRSGGATTAEVAPLVLGFVGTDRSRGDTGYLAWLHRLERLDLSRLDGLVDQELACLVDLPDLVALNLDQRHGNNWFARRAERPTDAALPAVGTLRRLRDLNLAGTRVTDAGLVHLAGLGELRMLDLSQTGVTDAGLIHLKGLKGLGYVGLRGTRVSDRGAAALKAALPGADVDHESAPTPR